MTGNPQKPAARSRENQPQEVLDRKSRGSRKALRRRLSGDLDNIVLMALRKEPACRYTSVEQLAADIRRHLDGLPVAAVKGSVRYRTGKFIRRHRAALTAGALLVLTVAAGLAATVQQARIARRQAERAEKRFSDVRELANSLIFEIHDSIQGLPGATPSRKLLLDRAVQYLDKLSQDSTGDVNLQRELGWAYYRLATVQGDTTQSNLGQVGAAEISNRKAMALFEAVAKANPNNVTDQINLAMAYRWRAFFDIYEKTGLAEINRALAVTEPLMRTNGDNVDLQSERAKELQIFADIQDATGNRLQSIDAYQKVRDLWQAIVQKDPKFPGARQALAKATVILAHETGRFASREEGLRLMNAGITDFEALVRETSGDPGMIRELGAAEGRRGEVELMRGDIAAARKDFQRAQKRIERLAKLDPENKMLQSDIWVARFEDGRALAVAGRYSEALPALEDSHRGYTSLHLEADVGPGPPAMQAWIGVAQEGTRNLTGALKNYEAAAAALAEDQANFDDARCDLAMVQTKMGNVLLKMGKVAQSRSQFERALDVAKLEVSLDHNDFPALYAAADAYTGLGDLDASQARRAADGTARTKLLNESCTSYENSLTVWTRISSPSRLSGNGYLATLPQEVMRRLEGCKAELPAATSPSSPGAPQLQH